MVPFLLFLLICLPTISCSSTDGLNSIYLDPGDTIHYQPQTRRVGFFATDLRIYCYKGSEKSLAHIFQSIQLRIEIDTDDFMQYDGTSPEMVQEHYNSHKSIFSFNILSNKKTLIKLNPFNQTCIGIETSQPYRLRLQLIRVDFWRLIHLSIGILTFLYAAKLSGNSLFYYLSGIFLGIFASFLLVIYFGSKLVPRKPMMYGVLVGGWTVAIYFGQMLWDNLQMILVTYRTYVFWYVLITGFTSFIICYRMGPPTNKRSREIIKWGLQLFSLVLIFYSSEYQEATAAINILVVLAYYLPKSWIYRVRSIYARKFPPKRRLLTTEEFYEEGARETTKALDELRKYCSSPDCKQWKVVSALKDPVRFASFMEGSSHLLDEEILEYETSRAEISDSEVSEDENESDHEDENNGEISEDGEAAGTATSRTIDNYFSKQSYPRGLITRSTTRSNERSRSAACSSATSTSDLHKSRGSSLYTRRYNREISDED